MVCGPQRDELLSIPRPDDCGGLGGGPLSLRNVVLLPFLTRGLTLDDYGAFVQAVALVELLGAFIVTALSSALARFASSSADRSTAA